VGLLASGLRPGVVGPSAVGDRGFGVGSQAGLVDETCGQGHGGEVVAQPGTAAFDERGPGAIDEVEGAAGVVRAGLVVTATSFLGLP